jgi:exosortase/archaeosortase family protein
MHNEGIWALQRATASSASALLDLMGYETTPADAFFRVDDRAFMVVEACSGLRGMEILTLVAVVIREVFADCGARSWWTVVIAPPLAMVLNVVRVTSVSFTEDPGTRVSIAPGHLGQGLTVLVVGTILLYLLGLVLARGRTGRAVEDASRWPTDRRWLPERMAYASAAWAGLLVTLSFVLPTATGADVSLRAERPPVLDVPLDHAGWKGEDLVPDRLMIGQLPLGEIVHRRYERRGIARASVVDLFVAYERDDAPRQSPFSSKLLLPGHGWTLDQRSDARIWELGLDTTRAEVTGMGTRRLVYQWNVRDPGALLGNLRSLLALGATTQDGGRLRAVVRVATPLAGPGPSAKDQSKQALDHFVRDFRRYLADL